MVETVARAMAEAGASADEIAAALKTALGATVRSPEIAEELTKAMDEAYSFKFGEPLRSLFVAILLFSRPSDPRKFYEAHKLQILEDWIHTSDLVQAERRFACTFALSIMIELLNCAGSC